MIIPPAGGIPRGGLVTSPSNSKKKTIYDKSTKKSNLPEILVDWLMPLFSMLSRIGLCLGLKIYFSDQWDC